MPMDEPDLRTLLLLRHAKSSWKRLGLTDHDRPLNKRGRKDAPRLGRFVDEAGVVPDMVISSTALRAAQTAELAVVEWGGDPVAVWYSEAIYQADDDGLLAVLAALPHDVSRVMIIGHNPSLEELVTRLTGRSESMPTCSLAIIALHVDHWSDMAWTPAGDLLHIWRPKENPESDGDTADD